MRAVGFPFSGPNSKSPRSNPTHSPDILRFGSTHAKGYDSLNPGRMPHRSTTLAHLPHFDYQDGGARSSPRRRTHRSRPSRHPRAIPPNPIGPTRSTEGNESIEKIPTEFCEADTGDHVDVRFCRRGLTPASD
jgi:hypothetical protein